MRYLLALLVPPLAVLVCGKPAQALLNCMLCFCLWIPAVVHALFVVSSTVSNEQMRHWFSDGDDRVRPNHM